MTFKVILPDAMLSAALATLLATAQGALRVGATPTGMPFTLLNTNNCGSGAALSVG